MNWGIYLYVFFLAHVKFLFAASIAQSTTDLSFLEILLCTTIGAIFCFNLFFWLSKKMMDIAHKKRIKAYREKGKTKKNFTKKNKWIIKIKRSKMGFVVICTLAPLFLSIPIGTMVVVKFYGNRPRAYLIVTITLLIVAYLLTYLNDYIFSFF